MLVTLFGESKQGNFDNTCYQYQFNSPWAREENGGIPDNKYNLEVSFSLGKYHEWATNYGGNLSSLIKEFGGKSFCDEYFHIINEIKENKYYNLDMFKDNGDIFEERYLKLPKTFTKIYLESCRDKELKDYLLKRGITQDIIDEYNIGRTTWDEEDWTWRNRIIFPSYNAAGDLNYYIGRTYRSKDKRNKYKNCDADKSKIILHEDKINWDADIYLVEGAIDCIYYPNAISLIGKVINKKMELYSKIKERANANVIICLDSDTTMEEVKRAYSVLNRGRLFGKIKYIRLGEGLNGRYVPYTPTEELHVIYTDVEDLTVHADKNPQIVRFNDKFYEYEGFKDFGEIYEVEGKKGIIKAMRTAKQFSEIELVI